VINGVPDCYLGINASDKLEWYKMYLTQGWRTHCHDVQLVLYMVRRNRFTKRCDNLQVGLRRAENETRLYGSRLRTPPSWGVRFNLSRSAVLSLITQACACATSKNIGPVRADPEPISYHGEAFFDL
jgi:hypothetical protein